MLKNICSFIIMVVTTLAFSAPITYDIDVQFSDPVGSPGGSPGGFPGGPPPPPPPSGSFSATGTITINAAVGSVLTGDFSDVVTGFDIVIRNERDDEVAFGLDSGAVLSAEANGGFRFLVTEDALLFDTTGPLEEDARGFLNLFFFNGDHNDFRISLTSFIRFEGSVRQRTFEAGSIIDVGSATEAASPTVPEPGTYVYIVALLVVVLMSNYVRKDGVSANAIKN